MKILILGSNSTIGKDLIHYLNSKNQLFLVSRKKFLINKKINIIKNINFNELNKIKYHKFDLLINCIATHNFSKRKSINNYIDSNIKALIDVLTSGIKIKLILNLSTISKFDLTYKKNINEKTKINMNSILGITKSCLDELMKFQKTPYINLLLPGVITNSGEPKRPFLKKLIYMLKSNQLINVTNISLPFNSFVDSYEIYNFINHILKIKKFSFSGDYILSPNNYITLKYAINYIANYLKIKTKYVNLGKDDKNYLLNNSKLKKILNFYPSSAKDILHRILVNTRL